ncbi:Uncharacterised protein [uncultured Eubacterium sp.]|uniref:hypothetical protein n=1 Tax=Emergencia sp. TaxID=1926557 RepID=UPI0008220C7F|nr:Uncharacterised protein [uncultured Eubacterium sp.]
MKKVIGIFTIVLMVMISTLNCFAATVSTNQISDQRSTDYVVTQNHITTFTIKSDGTANMRGALTPQNKSLIDNVKVSFVIKDISGNVVYNKTHTAVWSSLYGQYIADKNHNLSKKGTYTLRAKYMCYKNGSLIETIYSTGIVKTY